jgi:hypothetical protein
VHVGSLSVLDDLVQEHLVVLGRLHPAGQLRQIGLFGGFESALAGDDAVDVPLLDETDRDRLQDTEPGDGGRQFALGGRVEAFSWLIGVWLDAIQVDEEGAAETPATFERPDRRGCIGTSPDYAVR